MLLQRLIGHRGASAYAPENTLASFQKAYALGCRCIEFDVMLSRDGEAFVFHDNSLHRTTNGHGEVGLSCAEYIRSLDAGAWFSPYYSGEKVPSFRQVIEWLMTTDMQANIEIKPYPGATQLTTLTVLEHLKQYWEPQRPLPLLSSFEIDALILCRKLSSEIPLGLLLHRWQTNWLDLAIQLNCVSIHINQRILNQARVQELKQHPFKIYTYTVNSKRRAKTLFQWGVDAVFSDRPDLLST